MGTYSHYNEDQLSNIVIGVVIDVHSQVDPCILE